jgi:hypothetical protein
LFARKIRASANQAVLEIIELLAGIRRAAGAFEGQIDANEVLIVDKAAIGLVLAGAFDRFARACFDTGLPYLRIAQATFRIGATSFETETVDTPGATVTRVFGRTRVRAITLVDANSARRGIATRSPLAAVVKAAAFASDTDSLPGLPRAADLRFRIAPRTADIGLLIADQARIAAVGIGATGAVDRGVIANPAVGAPVATGEQVTADIDAADIRHVAATTTEGLFGTAEFVASPTDGVAAAVELAAELVGPTALRAIGRRADMLQRWQLAVTVVRRATKLFAVAGTSAAGPVATLGMAGKWRGNRIFGAAGGSARFQSGRTAAASGARNLLPRTSRRFGRWSRPPRGLDVVVQEGSARNGDSPETEHSLEQIATVGSRGNRFGECVESSVFHEHIPLNATTWTSA